MTTRVVLTVLLAHFNQTEEAVLLDTRVSYKMRSAMQFLDLFRLNSCSGFRLPLNVFLECCSLNI
jgi:hypothetical protein